uniref:Peptidase S1 domain-containing protein n=1 Tax=Anopheles merus TaxID=30066 RepID=A0A182UXP3_ANOME
MHYKCGGSIIDESTILTASHCVYTQSGVISISRVSVDVGRIHLNESSEYTQMHRVREIIVHPGFSKNSIVNDIALIKLSSNITMNKYVQPVCLWTMDSNQELIVGKNGTIVGFGYNEQDILSDQLKQALIGVEDTFSCIASDRGVFGTHLTSDMFCGKGRKGVSACNGDSGGGMFFEIGALCDPLKNTAYTDVAKYLEWIKPYIDERFNINNSTDNIALIELLSPADTTQPNVKPICLPVTAELRTREPSSLSVPTKFGRTIELKSIPVRYLEAAECMRQYTQRQIVLELGNKWICAELVNKQDSLTCRALEAGAPLQETKTFNGTERHFLWGFELHGSACNVHPPPVYIDIEAYLDWILYNMRYNVLETTDSDKITITKELLESEWSKLRQQPGKERLRLFNMDTCGIVSPHYQILR